MRGSGIAAAFRGVQRIWLVVLAGMVLARRLPSAVRPRGVYVRHAFPLVCCDLVSAACAVPFVFVESVEASLVFVGSLSAVGAAVPLVCPVRAVPAAAEAVGSVSVSLGLVVALVVDVVASLVFLVRVALVALAAADLAVAFLVGVVPAVAAVFVLVGVAAQILAGPGSCV